MTGEVIRILVVDDDALVRRSLCEVLAFEGHSVMGAPDAESALSKIKNAAFDIVISDVKMSGMGGLDLLRNIRKENPEISVIMVTGHGSIENAVEAMKEGAVDYIAKPIVDNEIKLVIKRVWEKKRLVEENRYLRKKLSSEERSKFFDIVGKSYKMQKIYDLIDVISATKTTVLITGESGTGKRLVAYAVHHNNPQNQKAPFIEVSCGALPETLLESELFGHVKGAFTGAIRDRAGRFELAEGGTIFLDEIDAFSPALQVKLLRVLQDGEFERVGETKTRKANVRIIAATNQDLQKCIKESKFRNDLYYRLNIISIELPVLSQRGEDIPLLAEHFVEKHSTVLGKVLHGISDEAVKQLMDYPWPGNVRELENVIERACVLTKGPLIGEKDLPEHLRQQASGRLSDVQVADCANGEDPLYLKDALKMPEKQIILEALEKSGWNKKEAAQRLGINRTTLYKKLNLYGIAANKRKTEENAV